MARLAAFPTFKAILLSIFLTSGGALSPALAESICDGFLTSSDEAYQALYLNPEAKAKWVEVRDHPSNDGYQSLVQLMNRWRHAIDSAVSDMLRAAFNPLLHKATDIIPRQSRGQVDQLLGHLENIPITELEPIFPELSTRGMIQRSIRSKKDAALSSDDRQTLEKAALGHWNNFTRPGMHDHFRATKFKLFTGQFSGVLWSPVHKIDLNGRRAEPMTTMVFSTPVGEYGTPLARALHRTNQVVMLLASRHLNQESASAMLGHGRLLSRETARGADGGKAIFSDSTPESAALAAFVEGINSMTQALAQLTAQKVYDSSGQPIAPLELVRMIIFEGQASEGVISDLARRLSMGTLGPVTVAGRFFEEPLVVLPSGKVDLSPDFKQALLQLKAEAMEKLKITTGINDRHPGVGGRGCPFAAVSNWFKLKDQAPTSALNILARSYFQIFEKVYQAQAFRGVPSGQN